MNTDKHGLGKDIADLEPFSGLQVPTCRDSRYGHFLSALCIGFVVAAATGLCGCSGKSAGTGKPARANGVVAVVVAQADAKDMPVELRNIGNMVAYSTVNMPSPITG